VLSGPEGGFSADEEGVAAVRGFRTVTLGERVLRADTAPLAALAALALQGAPGLSAATAG
jgi:16S rRNA (uracil1498-N3)-methyltransferase